MCVSRKRVSFIHWLVTLHTLVVVVVVVITTFCGASKRSAQIQAVAMVRYCITCQFEVHTNKLAAVCVLACVLNYRQYVLECIATCCCQCCCLLVAQLVPFVSC